MDCIYCHYLILCQLLHELCYTYFFHSCSRNSIYHRILFKTQIRLLVGYFRLLYMLVAFSALTVLLGSRKGIRHIKNGGMVEVGTA